MAATSGLGSALTNVLSEVPGANNAFSSGDEMALSASDVSPSAQQGILQTLNAMAQLQEQSSGKTGEPSPVNLSSNAGQVGIRLNGLVDQLASTPLSGTLLGDIQFTSGNRTTTIPIVNPDDPVGKLVGRAYLASMDEGVSLSDALKDMPEFTAAMSEMSKNVHGDPETKAPDDPGMCAKITIKANNGQMPLEDLLSSLADATGLGVVSNSFGTPQAKG